MVDEVRIALQDTTAPANTNGTWNELDFNESLTHILLPFYSRYGSIEVFIDCLYLNDSAERVELGDAPVMDNCGKLVVQKQTARSGSEISIEVEEGNFEASDNVYAFVVNSDTQYTAGTLIRSGT